MVTNHQTGAVIPLLRPPVTAAQNGLPGWVMPAAIMLSGGDAATSFIDPTLPALVAGGAVLLLGSSIVTRTVVVPRLKQLPDNKLGMEAVGVGQAYQYNLLFFGKIRKPNGFAISSFC